VSFDMPPHTPTSVTEPIYDLLVLEDVMPWSYDFIEGVEEVNVWDEVVQTGLEPGTYAEWKGHTVHLSGELRHPGLGPFEQVIQGVVGHCLQIYHDFNHYMMSFEDQGYRMHRFSTGHYLKEHCDQKRFPDPLHPHTMRKLTMAMYLNDDYEGGELHFTRRNFTLKPKAGMVAIYPSNFAWPHESKLIKSGTKYSIATWLF